MDEHDSFSGRRGNLVEAFRPLEAAAMLAQATWEPHDWADLGR